MLELLELAPGMKVLEIGAGTGYNAALMAELVGDPGQVIAIDIQEDVVDQTKRLLAGLGYGEIKLLGCDGFMGAAEHAPFDRIVATVGCPDLAPHWIAQLKPDGFLLIPLMFGAWDPLVKVWRDGSQLKGKIVANAGFMPLQGELHQASDWWFLRSMSLPLESAKNCPSLAGFEPRTLRDFYDFALIRDRRTVWNFNPDACSLFDKDMGFILARETGEILLLGEQPLYDDLYMLYQQWEALGKPRRGDYELEFLPLTQATSPTAERSWIIERKFYRQMFMLPEGV
jgi:protein-L-isoaspartate(D-aspartate) O-methyltransferase